MSYLIESDSKEGSSLIRIQLSGDVDVSEISGFYEELSQLENRNSSDVEVACDGLEFLDASAIQLLLALKKECAKSDKALRFKEIPEAVVENLNSLGFKTMLTD